MCLEMQNIPESSVYVQDVVAAIFLYSNEVSKFTQTWYKESDTTLK